ncbi:hypothetical protein EDB84DRAFT_1444485 [Lactarius hengduanensis]|nr:hypothetical protein EDB84DRAFT_1444485 [Lactarius hengduanensis]
MSAPRPGTAYLSSRAVLQEPRSLPGHSNVLIFDAVVRPAQTTLQVSNISCSLQYTKRNSEEEFHAGIYDILATLRLLPPETNPLTTVNYPSRIVATGTTSAAHPETENFTMTVSQMPWRASPRAQLQIRGLMALDPRKPYSCVPPANTMIAFTGQLLAFDDAVATVAVDDVAILPCLRDRTAAPFARLTLLACPSHRSDGVEMINLHKGRKLVFGKLWPILCNGKTSYVLPNALETLAMRGQLMLKNGADDVHHTHEAEDMLTPTVNQHNVSSERKETTATTQ